MRRIVTTAVLAALVAAPALAEQTLEGVADATYQLDPNHSFLTFNVTHNGISTYTVYFTDFDATLDFNPEDPTASTLNVTINPAALEANYPADYKAGHPDSEFESWNDALSNDDRFLQADEYGEITFTSTSAEMTGDYTGTVTGDLSFRGETHPITLDVTYNGVGNVPWMGERDLLGFTASTTIDRTEFGMDALPGVISNDVGIEFSGEFIENE